MPTLYPSLCLAGPHGGGRKILPPHTVFFFLFLLLGWYRAEILCRSLVKVTFKAKSK